MNNKEDFEMKESDKFWIRLFQDSGATMEREQLFMVINNLIRIVDKLERGKEWWEKPYMRDKIEEKMKEITEEDIRRYKEKRRKFEEDDI